MIDINILSKLKNISVLLVEDDENTRIAISQSLEFCCKNVRSAKDGLSGFETYFKDDFDIIVTDINLPKLSGLEMLDEIKKRDKDVKSVIITSYDTNENMLASIELGAYNYLRKPFKIDELQTTILMATQNSNKSNMEFLKEYRYDFKNRILYKNNKQINMTKMESNLFHLLAKNPNTTVSYEKIENFVWKEKRMSNEALRMAIKKIRLKTNQSLIQNVSGVGYKLKF